MFCWLSSCSCAAALDAAKRGACSIECGCRDHLSYNPAMTLDEFKRSIKDAPRPAKGMHPVLEALWQEARGDWERAHRIAQEDSTSDGSWVHAYLHRKEGDAGNAGYWYKRAGRPFCRLDLDREWEEIARHLLGTVVQTVKGESP
jgi:hypothetical protein